VAILITRHMKPFSYILKSNTLVDILDYVSLA